MKYTWKKEHGNVKKMYKYTQEHTVYFRWTPFTYIYYVSMYQISLYVLFLFVIFRRKRKVCGET